MIMETILDRPVKNKSDDINLIIQEYETIIESLQQDLKYCQTDQARLRAEVEGLKIENQTALDIAKDAFTHANITECPGNLINQECIENLKKQISIIQMEKESMFQLWQMALKAVEALEQEIKANHTGEKAKVYYEEQVNNVKKAYTEAIQTLEAKLIQARDSFTKCQILWESSRDKYDNLKAEKTDCEKQLLSLQTEIVTKDAASQKIIESLKAEICAIKQQFDVVNNFKLKLETELIESRCFAAKISAKDQESKEKVAEAIELIETAVSDKERTLEKLSAVVEEKSKLEKQIATLSEEFAARLDKELIEVKNNFDKHCKEYILEINELKSELCKKSTSVDRAQRECQLVEEELEKTKHSMDDFVQKSNSKIQELESKLKCAEYKLNSYEDECRQKYEEKLRDANNKAMELEDKLSHCNEKFRRNQANNLRDMEERLRESDDRTKEAIDRYSSLEKRLARALDERENFASELRTLQVTFDREITRRDNERRMLEGRIRELQEDLRNANDLVDKTTSRANSLIGKITTLERNMEEYRSYTKTCDDKNIKIADLDKSLNYSLIREQYEAKLIELNKCVKTHQNLSNRWKEEAESLADKFQQRYKELRSTINRLQNENEKLNNELVVCRQQLLYVNRM